MRPRVIHSPIEIDIIYIYQSVNIEYFVEFVQFCVKKIRISSGSGLRKRFQDHRVIPMD